MEWMRHERDAVDQRQRDRDTDEDPDEEGEHARYVVHADGRRRKKGRGNQPPRPSISIMSSESNALILASNITKRAGESIVPKCSLRREFGWIDVLYFVVVL